MGQQTPALVLHWATGDLALPHLRHKRFEVVEHQIEVVQVVLVGRMHRDFRRRQSEDQPSLSHIDVRQPQYVAQEGAVGIRLRAVDNRMAPTIIDSPLSAFAPMVPPFPAVGGGGVGRRGATGTSKVKSENMFRVSALGIGEPFMMPSASGSTKELTDQEQGNNESLSITVLEVPKGE